MSSTLVFWLLHVCEGIIFFFILAWYSKKKLYNICCACAMCMHIAPCTVCTSIIQMLILRRALLVSVFVFLSLSHSLTLSLDLSSLTTCTNQWIGETKYSQPRKQSGRCRYCSTDGWCRCCANACIDRGDCLRWSFASFLLVGLNGWWRHVDIRFLVVCLAVKKVIFLFSFQINLNLFACFLCIQCYSPSFAYVA